MEDFQSNWAFEAEKISNGFLAPSTSLQGSRTFHKDRLLENFESPNIFRAGQAMKPNLPIFDRMSFLPINKEDDFVLDSAEGLKIEHQDPNIQYYPPQGNQPQLDIMMEGNHHYLRMPEYDVENYQINRSRGPSFNISKERRGSEDFFSTGLDFMRLFRNFGDQYVQDGEQQQHQHQHHGVKTEFDQYPGQEENIPLMYNFQHLLPAKENHLKEHQEAHSKHENYANRENSDEMAADESTLQLSVQGSEPEHLIENPLSAGSNNEGDSEPTPKKKRKTNTNKAIIEEPNKASKISKGMPKLKKSKSENKNVYSITPKGNSLSLKIVKRADGKDSEASKLKPKKTTSKAAKSNDSPSDDVKVEDTQASLSEKPFEMPANVGNSQSDLAPLMRSKSSNLFSSFFQGKTPGSFSDLVAGLGLPAEVEEMLNNSKIFNNIQSSMTRKIGPLTVEERRIKVEKYFEKRKNRTWSKRINYDCRKRVADSRLRFKGRFVTKTQAFGMLAEEGIFPDPNKITESEIKELLEERFGSDPVKKKEKEGDGRKNNGRPKKQNKMEQEYVKKEESGDDGKSSIASDDDY